MSRPLWVAAAAVAVAASPACSEYELSPGGGHDAPGVVAIDVSPRAIDFLGAAAAETVTATVEVTNVGAARASLDPLTLDAADSFALLGGDWPDWLDPGERVSIEVAFSPEAARARDGLVTVRSNDDDEPEIPVSLTGFGMVPELRISPDPTRFGAIPVGCDDPSVVTLENVGEDELVLQSIEIGDDSTFVLAEAPAVPFHLAPGAWTEARVTFAPRDLGHFEAAITVASNEPRGRRDAALVGQGASGGSQTDRFDLDDDPPVDLLFAIDQSCSMDDDAGRVADELGPLLDAIGAVTNGWQVGVVTLDSGCVNDQIFDARTTDLQRRFTDAALLGEDRDVTDDEALLKLTHRALSQTEPGACNDGLVRAGAALHVIVVSDEPERSAQERAAWTWDYWLAAISDATPAASARVVSGIVDSDGCNDGDDGYAQIIAATGGARLSLCAADWSGYARALADASLAQTWTLPLSEDPVDGTLTVTIDGVDSDDWTYDADSNAVVLGSDPGAAQVSVTYEVRTECGAGER